MHPFLNNNTLVIISNPFNSKSLTAKIRKTINYPSIYNIVITKKMADKLELDINNPYVEVLSIRENDKFIAKEASIFDEEKKVANKAPVTSININDMSTSTPEIKVKKKKPSYIIEIAEFYFLKSAETVKNRFEKEANLENIKIKKISKTRSVTSQMDFDIGEENIHIGPSDYVPWLGDRKYCYIKMEGIGFGDTPINMELKLEVWDSPNSAGVVIDAIRCAKVALDRGISGTLVGPSAYFMKSPPIQFPDDEAFELVEGYIDGKDTGETPISLP